MKTVKFLALFLIVGVLAAFTTATTEGGYKVGDIATDFSLKSTDGKMVSLKDYKNAKGFIVVFTCNHCPYAKAYEDRIIALDKKIQRPGLPGYCHKP